MKSYKTKLLLGLVLGSALQVHSAFNLVPNGDFEDPAGPETNWLQDSGGGTFTFLFPATDGNPDAHAVIDNIDTGFGILVANNNEVLPLSGLGLTAGETYTFSQDMRFTPEAVFGSATFAFAIGGMKIEYFVGSEMIGSTGDMYPEALLDNGDTWQTYEFDVNIPISADGIKVVALWGPESTVSFDNVGYDDVPLPALTEIPNGDFEIAAGDSWGLNDDAGAAVISFPATGGNADGSGANADGGFASIDTTNASFGVLISHSDQILPLLGLGLTPGQTYDFKQDMRVLAGSEIGGLKVEFFSSGLQHSTTGNLFPVATDPANWNTYSFPIRIPANADGIKVILLGGSASEVGFDNVFYETTPVSAPPLTDIPNGDFSEGQNNWGTAGDENTTFTFPNTGGNPDGYVSMDNNGSGFGVLVANASSSIPLEYLGLSGGNAYQFSMDTFRESGTDVGDLKIEFFSRGIQQGDTGDMSGSAVTGAWTTDDFVVSLPANTDAIRVVPVAGSGSVIRFDNITVDATPIVPPVLPNLDFELGAANWTGFQSNTSFSFPATGGNPDGHGRMDNLGGGFGVLIANTNGIIPLADLGLTAGTNIDLKVDMKIFAGFNIGGVKIEYYSGTAGGQPTGDQTPDTFPTLIGDGSTWERYTFDNLFVPTNIASGGAVDGIKIVLLWGDGSDVGYDNVEVVTPDAPASITITDCGFDSSGNFYIDVEEGVVGLLVTSSPDLNAAFNPVNGVTNDGANRFTIPSTSLDSNTDGADFFRVVELP